MIYGSFVPNGPGLDAFAGHIACERRLAKLVQVPLYV